VRVYLCFQVNDGGEGTCGVVGWLAELQKEPWDIRSGLLIEITVRRQLGKRGDSDTGKATKKMIILGGIP
jgi:hypothetical protein